MKLPELALTLSEEKKGIVVTVNSNYYVLLSERVKYLAHKSENRSHYELGSKVSFVSYRRGPIQAALIHKTISRRSKIAEELYSTKALEKEFRSVTFAEIAEAGGVAQYSLIHKVKYHGILRICTNTFFLFEIL